MTARRREDGIAGAAEGALQRDWPNDLASALESYLGRVQAEWNVGRRDDRDVMVGLALFHDCARRLGTDPVTAFDRAADTLSPELAELVRGFARRDDITLEAFAWRLEQTPDGLRYLAC